MTFCEADGFQFLINPANALRVCPSEKRASPVMALPGSRQNDREIFRKSIITMRKTLPRPRRIVSRARNPFR